MRTFTSRQVLLLLVGCCVVSLLLPTSVQAAGSALTRITDGKGHVAKVDRSGRLLVGDGGGPLTVDGSVSVAGVPTVRGTVDSRMAPATQPWMNVNGTSLGSATQQSEVLHAGTGAHPIHITTFSASVNPGSTGPVSFGVSIYVGEVGDSCYDLPGGSFGAAERFRFVVPVGDTVVQTFPSPLTFSAYAQGNEPFCVVASGSGSGTWSGNILANGFIG